MLCRGAAPVLDVITPVTKTPFFRVPSFNYPSLFLSLLMLIMQYVEAKLQREINTLSPDIVNLSSFDNAVPGVCLGSVTLQH